jgi:hypothetical protein
VGKNIPTHKTTDDDGNLVDEEEEQDEDKREAIEATWTKEQKANRLRDKRRAAAVDSTKDEVDLEAARLMKKAKTGRLTLADVDAMRERKDLEYQIELESNVNLTADAGPGRTGDSVNWSKEELELVRTTLARLPQAHGPTGLSEIHRVPSMNIMDSKGGDESGGKINLTDWGASPGEVYSHGGEAREMVSDTFRREHADKVNTLEYVLTHEIGHSMAEQHPMAFKKFQKAAGWDTVKVDALRKDHISEADLKQLEADRPNPNVAQSNIGSDTRTYTPIQGRKDDYWASDKTAIPSANEATPSTKGADTWQYSRVDPAEHFAETYAKGGARPREVARRTRRSPGGRCSGRARAGRDDEGRDRRSQDASQAAAKLEIMTMRLEKLEADAATKEKAERQRGDEYRIMRNDVFGTDKAVVVATQRLQAKKVSAEKIAAFQQRAEHAATPEQVGVLESEVTL